jgi:uncharacterized iron-regulated membrane protein
MATAMSLRDGWRRWVDNPQGLRWRKALLKLHLWVALTTGLYIILISVTGAVAVFRRDLAEWLMPRRTFTGSTPQAVTLMEWFVDLHDNLLAGDTGRLFNGFGAISFTLLIFTGFVLWWPGRTRWWRSLIVPRPSRTRRFTWHLHTALAFWGSLLLFGWAITGIYFAFPDTFNVVFDQLPTYPGTFVKPGEDVLQFFTRLHFGRQGGLSGHVFWAVTGLLPVALFVTGFIVWWQRRQLGRTKRNVQPIEAITPASINAVADQPAGVSPTTGQAHSP